MSKIVLISDNEEIKKSITKASVCARATDAFLATNRANSDYAIKTLNPDVVLVFEGDFELDESGLDFVRDLRENFLDKTTSIVYILQKKTTEFITRAYSCGINDYFVLTDTPEELREKVKNCLIRTSLARKISALKNQMAEFKILEKSSGFYAEPVLGKVISRILEENCDTAHSYMALYFSDKNLENPAELKTSAEYAIKQSVREKDVVSARTNGKYTILSDEGIEAAINIYEKIKKNLPSGIKVRAGIVAVCDKKFEVIDKKAFNALNSAILGGADYKIYLKPEREENWMEEESQTSYTPQTQQKSEEKNFKLFKNAFKKKVENVIAPIFSRLQTTYETGYSEIRIAQFSNEYESVFGISEGTRESRLSITSPKFSDVIISQTHSGLDSPENEQTELKLNEVTEEKIVEIVENFITDFINRG